MHQFKKAVEILQDEGVYTLSKEARSHIYRKYLFHPHIYFRCFLSQIKHDPPIKPLKVYWVNPDRIEYKNTGVSRKYIGTVRGGDWDKQNYEFVRHRVYQGLYERFVKGFDWEDTQYYQFGKEHINQEGEIYGHSTVDSFIDHRGEYLDNLYIDIKNNGYKQAKELKGYKRDKKRSPNCFTYKKNMHEITCHIGRNGDILLNGGKHRLSIAKILQLEKIPVQIVVRHRDWQEIRSEVCNNSLSEMNKDLHNHPDIIDILS